jgi:hypothetical protein
MTDSYTVTAKRWARGWELHINGVGVTQTSTVSTAEAVSREYIAFALDLNDETLFDVHVIPQLDAGLSTEIESARTRVRNAERSLLDFLNIAGGNIIRLWRRLG